MVSKDPIASAIARSDVCVVVMISVLLPRLGGAFDLRLAVSVPLPIVMGIFVLLFLFIADQAIIIFAHKS